MGQEIRVFTTSDFELKHQVKKCLVSTKYGKEEYDFNEAGFLTKSVTRFNDTDYDVIYYKFNNNELIEKRSESYRNNVFDSNTSIAHFYEIDTIPVRTVTEKIISYDKEFLDQYVYEYNTAGNLVKIMRTNNNGTDETIISYKNYKGEHTVTYTMNDELLKSIRTSNQKNKDNSVQEVVLTKEYLDGEANKAFEEVFDVSGKLLARQMFEYDEKKKNFVPTTRTTYEYDSNNMLISETAKTENITEKKAYIYQYDREEDGNWIKQIVTPDNTYTTRKIEYYESGNVAEEEE
ncbi:hypothetical protein [Maribacter sp. 2210JD10-5]|uniref:hypothetical protein n=1 Tax=Maribacter sp. 2210JD10-5 TaxID=3386272 RepID=UPI0039BD816E